MYVNSNPSLISGILQAPVRSNPGQAARKMEPLRRNIGSAKPAAKPSPDARRDTVSISERTMDVVVDRLLKELTW